MTDTSIPPELKAYLFGKSDSADPKERLLAVGREFHKWAQTECGRIFHIGLSPQQVEDIKLTGRRKIAMAIIRRQANFFRHLANAIDAEDHSNFLSIKDCVAHVYHDRRLTGEIPYRDEIKKEALELCARLRITMRRNTAPSKEVLAEEDKRLPAEIDNINASLNWDRIWRDLGLKNPRYIKGRRGRPKGSKNNI
jgi:hypothetical protein